MDWQEVRKVSRDECWLAGEGSRVWWVWGGRHFCHQDTCSPTRGSDVCTSLSRKMILDDALCCYLIQKETTSVYQTLQICVCLAGGGSCHQIGHHILLGPDHLSCPQVVKWNYWVGSILWDHFYEKLMRWGQSVSIVRQRQGQPWKVDPSLNFPALMFLDMVPDSIIVLEVWECTWSPLGPSSGKVSWQSLMMMKRRNIMLEHNALWTPEVCNSSFLLWK